MSPTETIAPTPTPSTSPTTVYLWRRDDDNYQIVVTPAEEQNNLTGGAVFGLAFLVCFILSLLIFFGLYRARQNRKDHVSGSKVPPPMLFENMAPAATNQDMHEGTDVEGIKDLKDVPVEII
jgi:hypothetical protein